MPRDFSTELTLKLYDIELRVVDTKRDERGREILKTLAKFPLKLNGSRASSDEGEWSTDDSGAQYFGQGSGYWVTKKDKDGMRQIWLMEAEDPNMISWLWRDMPQAVGMLEGIFKLPLFLGETGTGLALPVKGSGASLTWRVIGRGF